MGILVYSLLWVMQDFVHQPYIVPQSSLHIGTLGAKYLLFGHMDLKTLNPYRALIVTVSGTCKGSLFEAHCIPASVFVGPRKKNLN